MDLNKLKPTAGVDVTGKRVLVRADLNVPVADGKVTDATRLERVVPGLKDLCARGATVIVISHFGRPKGGPDPTMSLAPVAAKLAELLGRPVAFVADCIGDAAEDAVSRAGARRASPCSRTCASTRARRRTIRRSPAALATLGDIFVNDAFSARASRARLDRGPRAPAAGLRRAADDGGDRRAAHRAREAAAADGGRGRRRQGVDQDPDAHQPRSPRSTS